MYKILLGLFISCLLFSSAFASLRDDLFDDYKIYSSDVEKVINKTKKKVFKNINTTKEMLLENNIKVAKNKLNEIQSDILYLDEYIKKNNNKFKTQNMKDALTYPYIELSFYEKVIKEIVASYEEKGSITKKEIKAIEKKYKEEEKAIKQLAEDIKSDFLSAVFN